MTEFGHVALGILFGLMIAALLAATMVLAYASLQQRREAKRTASSIARVLSANTAAVNQLRAETSLALSRMDADRLHDAAISIQRGGKQLSQTVGMLWRLVYATTDTTRDGGDIPLPFSLDDEATEDARMLQDRRGVAPEDVGFPAPPPPASPWAHLSEADRRRKVEEFFAARRARTDTAGYATTMDSLAAAAADSSAREATPHLPDFDDDLELDETLGLGGETRE